MNIANMTTEQLRAALEAANAKLEAAKKASERKVTMKVSEKGAMSLYGLGRFPVTLYASQWERLVGVVKDGTVETFLTANADKLTRKDD